MNEFSLEFKTAACRINALINALGARKYLEVGVLNGGTFSQVKCDHKVAVDPNFRFDYKAKSSENELYYPIKSDQYFLSIKPQTYFDIVFLDGLHTFEQTYRDFTNALNFTHSRSVIVLDDTFPNDPYSSIKDQARSNEMRRHDKNGNKTWHGDVFKCVFAIYEYHPTLSYVTISGPGNPQTLVWKKPRANFSPKHYSFEWISRLDYFDLIDNFEIMQFQEAGNAVELCIADVIGQNT